VPPDLVRAALTVSAVIPTKHRRRLLLGILERLCAQTLVPDEILVVDQSDDDQARAAASLVIAAQPDDRRPRLVYLWDPAINGAAAARNAAFDRVASDVVLCVDDDMLPAPDAIERLLAHLVTVPALGAVTPVITNYAAPAVAHRLWSRVFYRGPFRDDRQPVYWRGADQPARLAYVGLLGAGMIALRRRALAGVRFDARYRGASLGEDIDLSWALRARGWRLAIATDAHVVHQRAPRPPARHEDALLTSWGFVYTKHQPKTPANRLAFAWFVGGVAAAAAIAALRARRLAPLASLRAGLFNIRHDYARCPFLTPPRPAPDATPPSPQRNVAA